MRGSHQDAQRFAPSDLVYRSSSSTQQEEKKAKFCVTADLLIPGKGEPIKDACIIVEGSKIIRVGKTADIGWQYGSDMPTTHVKVLMPGMWDCHVHFQGIRKADSKEFIDATFNSFRTGARCAKDAMLLLNSGFTSVRDCGGWGVQLDQAIEEGTIPGPKIYSANQFISMTGGHADVHSLNKPWYDDMCSHHNAPCHTADGVAECLRAIRIQLRAGASFIKICGSGGVVSDVDDPIDQQFSYEEVRVMVEEAARARRIIAAHCHGKPGIMNCLKAGVKTIEHGSYLDEECIDLMKEKGAILVNTRTTVERILAQKYLVDPKNLEKFLALADSHWNALKMAIAKGVTIATGTDTMGTIPGSKDVRFDQSGRELYYHVKAGMTPLQAIEAATANGPLTIGPQAPLIGQLKAGFAFDAISISKNPLEDISVLIGPDNISHVWKQGILHKSPGHPITCL